MKEQYLELSLERALNAYSKGDEARKQFLIDLYGKNQLLADIKDRVIDYPSACAELKIPQLTIEHFTFLGNDANRYFNRHQLTIIIRALNEGWEPDFTDNEYKYYNFIYWDDEKNGFSSLVSHYYDGTGVGSDLMLKSSDLAKHAYKIANKQYIAYTYNK